MERRANRFWAMAMSLALAGACEAVGAPAEQGGFKAFASQYCLACHSVAVRTADLDLEALASTGIGEDHSDIWEAVVLKLRGRQMPPTGLPRPDEQGYRDAIAELVEVLDSRASQDPQPGRTSTFRRLNRTEYANAIRDLLALEIDVEAMLPSDEASHGFDNITVGDLPPMLLERYVSTAEKISRVAVGIPGRLPEAREIRIPPDLTQEGHITGLPVGTRGGAVVRHTFPLDGEYEIQVRLARDRNEDIEGLDDDRLHQLEFLVDRERVALFDVARPRRRVEQRSGDRHLRSRLDLTAGSHEIGVAFLKDPSVLIETQRQPYQARFNYYRHPRTQPAVYSVTILGPFVSKGATDTPSRNRIFVCEPDGPDNEDTCAEEIVRTLAERAYRRPVGELDLEGPLRFYHQARTADSGDSGFDAAVERAVAAVLVSPQFLFRIEREPPDATEGSAYEISNLELASRLSFFLWSSIPDDELRDSAESGELDTDEGRERQVRRMLADSRSNSLVLNFAAQWLHLRNLTAIRPNMRLFPDFDDNLRQAFRRETELLLATVIREDRSVLDLLRPRFSHLNERLAKHYGVPNIYGSRFRKVSLTDDSVRGGLLRHGSVLTVTSYATRTSPVLRGKWILENLLGMPPPPPPADVPELSEKTLSGNLSVRERLAEHRENPACASCHNPMDPLGFALENYDAVGRWRTVDQGEPIDPSGTLVDGTPVAGPADLEDAILARPDLFVSTLTEKLLTFALGRGVEHYDAPTVRQIVRRAEEENYRFSSIILAIVESTPFRMRTAR